MRFRIAFVKTEAMRYIGNLDLFRTWERTIRRANLPLAYSQGFHPHPRLNLASALPLGFTSSAELLDIWLEKEYTPEEVRSALEPVLPPGLQIRWIEMIAGQAPALQTELVAAEYTLNLLDAMPELIIRLEQLLAKESLPRERRGKLYDLRPLILEARYISLDDSGYPRLWVKLAMSEGATGRPEEFILALGGDPANVRIHREKLIFKNQA